VYDLNKYEEKIKNQIYWIELLKFVTENERKWVCIYCYKYIKDNNMPQVCILNNMFSVPIEISCLNQYEKLLVQRSKCFQKITSTKTVMNKNLPFKGQMKKVRGTSYHSPLPLEKTVKKLCKDSDVINQNHELYIIVMSIPNSSKFG